MSTPARSVDEPPPAALLDAEAFILSGGAAKRAGGMNKSLMEVEGRPIIEHQLDRLRPVFQDRITLITDRPSDFQTYDVSTLPDFDEAAPEQRFPLRGLARALAAARGWAFLLAADMPWPEPDLLRLQWKSLLGKGSAENPIRAHVLEHDGRLQPFHAFFAPSLAPSARAALESEDRSLRRWIRSQPGVRIQRLPEIWPDAPPDCRVFTGFNTPPRS